MKEEVQHPAAQPQPQPGPIATIKVNNVDRSIHRGHQTVALIKTVGEVPQADELSEIIDGKLKELPDDGGVTIKGHEQFISSPRTGRSS